MKTKSKQKFLKLRLFGIVLGLSLSFSLSAQTWNLITTATTSDAASTDWSKGAIAIDGDYAVSRAVGAIYIFKRDETTYAWTQKQKILISSSSNYGNGSVAISGNYIAVIGGNSVTTGSLYVFKRDVTNDTWAQQKVLTPSDATGFSGAVSISGNYIVAGAAYESEDANGANTLSNAGAAYIYEQISGIWTEQQKIVASSRTINASFGNSVGISCDYVIVNDGTVFKKDSNTDIWVLHQTLGGSSDSFVGISKGNIIISSNTYHNEQTNTFDYYHYYGERNVSIYNINSSNNWTLKQTLAKSYSSYGDHTFHINTICQLSISGDYILFKNEENHYIFKKGSNDIWTEMQSFTIENPMSSCISLFVSGEDFCLGLVNSSSYLESIFINFYKLSSYITLSSTVASVGSTQNLTTSVNLIYNTPFTVTSNQPWLSVSPSGISPVVISDTVPLIFTASANSTTSARTAKVTIAGTGVSNQYIIVTQYVYPIINWSTPLDITYGTALSSTQLNATANVEGTFTYTPSLGTVLNAGTTQTLRVDFIPKDTVNYGSVSKTVQINVNKVVPVVTWATPGDINYGTALSDTQLNATSNAVGTYTFNPIAGTKLNAGYGQTLSVRFTPIDTVNFESVSKTVQINVKKVTPVITWSNPADIYYGDLLSSTQLNATANVEGNFTYSPAIGTKLNVGNGQTLSTQFKATDEINYELVSKQVSVNVIQPVLSLSTNAVNISFTGRETSTLTVNSNSPWVVISDQTWLTVTPSSGIGNGTITLSATENTTAFDRTAIVTIKGAGETLKTITVTQTKVLQIIANITPKWDDVLVCNNSDKLFSDYQWYKNDVSIVRETKQYYQEPGGLDGSYYVKVTTSDGTSGISNTIDVSKASKSIKVYPNPTENNQNFSLEIKATDSDLKQAELTILSVSGQIVLQNSNLQHQMQLNGLSRGCYIIHIRLTNGELRNEKLIVN